MFHNRKTIIVLITIVAMSVFSLAIVLMLVGSIYQIDLAGIRLATLFVSFAAFLSTSLFSLLIYHHNTIVKNTNDDANKRAELFREYQFASNNYSIIDFVKNVTIYKESSRYIKRFICKNDLSYHMIEDNLIENEICSQHDKYNYLTIKLPYNVVEGKMVSSISIDYLTFIREDTEYNFTTPYGEHSSHSFLLYNEVNKHNEAIINVITHKDSDFFSSKKINNFSKIILSLRVTSLLGVEVTGTMELYFTNPEKKESDGSNVYNINSSNFIITSLPKIIGISSHNKYI